MGSERKTKHSNAASDATSSEEDVVLHYTREDEIADTFGKVEIVKLNVGGTLFSTTMNTLKKYPNSVFGVLVSGRFNIVKDEHDAIFIDRDPIAFCHILNYMRGVDVIESYMSDREKFFWRLDCEYYGLHEALEVRNVQKRKPLEVGADMVPSREDVESLRKQGRSHKLSLSGRANLVFNSRGSSPTRRSASPNRLSVAN